MVSELNTIEKIHDRIENLKKYVSILESLQTVTLNEIEQMQLEEESLKDIFNSQ